MDNKKQVDVGHYKFNRYMTKRRWASAWHQIDEVLKYQPENVLEIGPGAGLFKAAGTVFGLDIKTLDIDSELKPDYCTSVFEMPFDNGAFDVVCAFQMLEHLPFEQSLLAFKEMSRVSNRALIISLPDAKACWPYSIYVPRLGSLKFFVKKPSLGSKKHVFDGQHYWELNKSNYGKAAVVTALENAGNVRLSRAFRVHENPYHHFMIFSK